MSISLFYFANCPLPFEADPLLDTATALAYCEKIQALFSSVVLSNVNGLSDLSRAVSHIRTCLTKRVEYIRTSCEGLPPNETPTFYGTPFDIPKVLKVLDDLAKSSEVSILSNCYGMYIGLMHLRQRKAYVTAHQILCLFPITSAHMCTLSQI